MDYTIDKLQSQATATMSEFTDLQSLNDYAKRNLMKGEEWQKIYVEYVRSLFQQVFGHRDKFFDLLLNMMVIESLILLFLVVINSIVFFIPYFHINETLMNILVGATIAQVSAMIIYIIKSEFPEDSRNIIGIIDRLPPLAQQKLLESLDIMKKNNTDKK